jgi:hypothetical protein
MSGREIGGRSSRRRSVPVGRRRRSRSRRSAPALTLPHCKAYAVHINCRAVRNLLVRSDGPAGGGEEVLRWIAGKRRIVPMAEPNVRRPHAVSALLLIPLSIVCLATDYALGPFIQFPIVYPVPVSLAAWHSGRPLSLALAVILPLCRLYFITLWDPPWTFLESAVNAAIRIVVLSSFAWLVDRTAHQTRRLSSEVFLLSGMLPVCRRCLKIRQAHDWQPLDAYVAQNPAAFQHELCPVCAKISSDLYDRR